MKKLLYFFLGFSTLVSLAMAQDDRSPVALSINGKPVTIPEFQYYYNKNGKGHCSVDEYVDLFVNYRLKVQAAHAQQLDTLSSFRKEFEMYRDKQLQPYMIDSLYEDSVALGVYARMQQQIGDSDLIKVQHILLATQAKDDNKSIQSKRARIDSIYGLLKQGADFSEVARTCSEDYATARSGGELPWIGPNAAIKEFEDVAYSLQKGQMSKPFQSPVGFHIVFMKDRKKLEPYEEKREELLKTLKAQGLDEMAFKHAVELKVKSSNGSLTREDVIQQKLEELKSQNPELTALIQDYYDGLLLFEVSKRDAWDPAEKDEEGLQNFFKKNRANYAWSEPRFKGFLFHAAEESKLKDVKALLKKTQNDKWTAAVRKTFNSGKTPQVIVYRKLYKEGENKFVDHLIFKKEAAKPLQKYPYTDVLGKILKKGPESYEDVRAQVVSDYQDFREKAWVKTLRQNAKIEINKEVLKMIEAN